MRPLLLGLLVLSACSGDDNLRARSRIVHHAEMEQRVGIAKHVARFLAAQIDLMKIDVLRATWHRPAIEPHDLPPELVMESTRDDPTEASADASDDDGLHQKMCFLPARPMWIIDWMR
jgi:hypothetical protein